MCAKLGCVAGMDVPGGRGSHKAAWMPWGQAVVLGVHGPLNPQGRIFKTSPPSCDGILIHQGGVGPRKLPTFPKLPR